MNKAVVLEHLKIARRHVIDGERLVLRQREIVAELGRDNHDSNQASELLRVFEDSLALHVQDRDRLEKEWADISN